MVFLKTQFYHERTVSWIVYLFLRINTREDVFGSGSFHQLTRRDVEQTNEGMIPGSVVVETFDPNIPILKKSQDLRVYIY